MGFFEGSFPIPQGIFWENKQVFFFGTNWVFLSKGGFLVQKGGFLAGGVFFFGKKWGIFLFIAGVFWYVPPQRTPHPPGEDEQFSCQSTLPLTT